MEKIKFMVSLYSEDPAEPAFRRLRGLFPVCKLCTEPGLTVLRPAPGIVLQLLTAAAQPPTFLMCKQPVFSYPVADLPRAIALGIEQGAVILQQSVEDDAGFSYCYLRTSGGDIFGLFFSLNTI